MLANYLSKKTTIFVAIFVLTFLADIPSSFSQNALVPFSFSLNTASKTSAGVFKRDGTLVRTLWNNIKYPAGTHKCSWDRKDDEGRLITDTGFVVKVVSNNVQYKWEGVIGNSSDSLTGSTVIRMFDRMHGMAVAGPTAYFGAGYTEGITSSYKFKTSNPQQKYNILYSEDHDMAQASDFVATDSTYVYWAGYDAFDNSKHSFVYATKISDDKEFMFTNGSSIDVTYGRTYPKAIDIQTGNDALPTGMAVQRTGKYLFVSHAGINEIHVLNKTTGALVQTISMTNPRDMAMDRNDNIWIISGTSSIDKYTVNSNGTLSSSTLSISSLSEPLALAVSPDNKTLIILDGGTSQQLKAFDNSNGNASWTYGQAGGYATDPTVTNDKFYLSDDATQLSKPFIAFQPDGSFWIGDVGNERVQHYSASRTFIDRIMSLPHSYTVVADRNDPTRVFNEYLEFKIDYSKPLAPDNGSWTLVKNWRRSITKDYFLNSQGIYNVFNNVITLSNGRTYATIENCSVPDARVPELVELPATGNLRYTGIQFEMDVKDVIETDGSLRRYVCDGKIGGTGYWETRPLTGFSKNNPVWGTSSKPATVPKIEENDPASGTVNDAVKTGSDIFLVFDKEKFNTGFHLGAVKKGDNKYLWKTSHATSSDYSGAFPTDGSFDIGNNVEYAGGHVYAVDKNILWNYHGEFWKNSQTNIWNHFYDNGLMVGQFGVSLLDVEKFQPEAYPMGAGNVFSSSVVKVGNDYYIYHNDESVHAAIHRWKIWDLNTIQEQTIAINYLPNTAGGLVGTFFNGPDLNNMNYSTAEVQTTVDLTTAPSQLSSSSNFSARWTGFVKPLYSQAYIFYTNTSKGARLWVDGELVIDKWTNASLKENSSPSVKLEAGKLYTIRMEINGGIGSLSWSSTAQPKQIIPSTCLFPSELPDYGRGINLMEGLHFKGLLTDGMYGWNRNSANEDNTNSEQYWHARTGVKSFLKDNPDLYMTFRRDNSTYTVTRDLGKPAQCMGSWKLSGTLSYDDDFAKYDDDNGGAYFDVLDDQGKIIARILREQYYNKNNEMMITIKCNGKTVVDMQNIYLYGTSNKPQPFELTVSNSGVTYKYAGFAPVTAALYDNAAHWSYGKTVKFSFVGSSANYDRMLNIHSLNLLVDASAAPDVTASGPITFCKGGSVTLTASSSSAYAWNTSETTQSITVTSTGTYYVNIKDGSGCTLSSPPVLVIVNNAPVPVITPSNSTAFCKGDSIPLVSSGASTYLWNTGAKTQRIMVSKTGAYSVTVKDANGCVGSSASTNVTENQLPVAVATPNGPTTFCQGKSVTISSNNANSYLWNNNDKSQTITATTSGNYSVRITDLNGCSSVSNTVTVQVDPIPVPTVTAAGVTTFCQGNNVVLTSSPATSYLWSNNETTQSITVINSGNYVVNAGDANGCSAPSVPLNVTVNAIPAPVVTVSKNILSSSHPVGNQWFLNGKVINGATGQAYTATESGDYSVSATENTCTGTSPVVAFVLDQNPNTSINGINTAKFTLFPNPSTGVVNIRYGDLTTGRIQVINAFGQVIKTFDSLVTSMDLSGYATGIYTIVIASEGQTAKQKLIIF